MECHVYRSRRREHTYLYLRDKDDFSELPEGLLKVFGAPEYSFSFELDDQRQLMQSDPKVVLKDLRSKGFHLHMPTDTDPLV